MRPSGLNPRHKLGVIAALTFASLTACDRQVTTKGECRPVHGADVCAFSKTMGGELASFGATVPIAAIESAPADAPMVRPPVASAEIPMPEIVRMTLGVHVLTIYWEAHGHPPAPFMVPHFDFHFDNAMLDEVKAIDCTDTVAFEKSMVIGYYHQKPIFFEPMIARATLLERRSFELRVPYVAGVPTAVRYPTQFRARYDSTAQSYTFEFANWGRPAPK